ncbi:DMT family transporter [Aliidiomarina sanyensis]|uniref:DMT family transporter n=1 Tax=Aliidiomarina sanyensis TaxID=1249555 RepID=UPI0023B8C252|nr:DMT family transporter [Aliidiomarina sanyensis]
MLLFAELCFAATSAMVKYLAPDIPATHLVFFRNFFALIVLLPWLYKRRQTAFRTSQLKLHLLRAVTGIAGMYLFFYVITQVALAKATLVLLMAPFIIPVISWFWLKERIGPALWFAIALGFLGVLIFLNPFAGGFPAVMLFAFLAAFLAAWAKTVIRKLSKTESPSKIVFYFSFFATVMTAIPVLINWQQLSWQLWMGVMLMGVFAVLGQLTMTRAFSMAPPSQIGVFTYSSVLFAALIGYLIWGEAFTVHMLVGTAIIMSAGYLTIRQNRSPAIKIPPSGTTNP